MDDNLDYTTLRDFLFATSDKFKSYLLEILSESAGPNYITIRPKIHFRHRNSVNLVLLVVVVLDSQINMAS